jgi:hypothetical protein
MAVIARVDVNGAVVDIQDVGGDVVEEALVVRNHQRTPAVLRQKLLEPADGQDVQVVGGLVQQHHVGPADQDLRQEHA